MEEHQKELFEAIRKTDNEIVFHRAEENRESFPRDKVSASMHTQLLQAVHIGYSTFTERALLAW